MQITLFTLTAFLGLSTAMALTRRQTNVCLSEFQRPRCCPETVPGANIGCEERTSVFFYLYSPFLLCRLCSWPCRHASRWISLGARPEEAVYRERDYSKVLPVCKWRRHGWLRWCVGVFELVLRRRGGNKRGGKETWANSSTLFFFSFAFTSFVCFYYWVQFDGTSCSTSLPMRTQRMCLFSLAIGTMYLLLCE